MERGGLDQKRGNREQTERGSITILVNKFVYLSFGGKGGKKNSEVRRVPLKEARESNVLGHENFIRVWESGDRRPVPRKELHGGERMQL